MKRRDFLFADTSTDKRVKDDILFQAVLAPKKGVLTSEDAKHLLKRTTYNVSQALIDKFTGMDVSDAVDMILGDGLDELPENEDRLPNGSDSLGWIGDPIEQNPKTAGDVTIRGKLEGILRNRFKEFVDWLIELKRNEVIDENNSSKEKFSDFLSTIWNIEFTYDTDEFLPPNLLYKNNYTLRKLRFSSYKKIAEEMTLDGAFLLYQSLNLSTKGNPNENYARELLELFTMGIGNYNEYNIREMSKLLTGWRTAPYKQMGAPNGYFNTYFVPEEHDVEEKIVFQKSFPARDQDSNNEFKVREEEVMRLITVIFEERADAIANFIMTKVYKFFVYSNPGAIDETFINQLATVFKDNDFNLRAVYKFLFTSDYFYEDRFRGIQIKTPVEFFLNLQSETGVSYDQTRIALLQTDQEIYEPINVAGWLGHRTWISTNTYPYRATHARSIVDRMSQENIFAYVTNISGSTEAETFINNLSNFVFPKAIAPDRLAYLKSVLLVGIEESSFADELANQSDTLRTNLIELIKQITITPDYHLT